MVKTFTGNVVYEIEEEYVVVAADEADAEMKITQAFLIDQPHRSLLLEVKDIVEVSHT